MAMVVIVAGQASVARDFTNLVGWSYGISEDRSIQFDEDVERRVDGGRRGTRVSVNWLINQLCGKGWSGSSRRSG